MLVSCICGISPEALAAVQVPARTMTLATAMAQSPGRSRARPLNAFNEYVASMVGTTRMNSRIAPELHTRIVKWLVQIGETFGIDDVQVRLSSYHSCALAIVESNRHHIQPMYDSCLACSCLTGLPD